MANVSDFGELHNELWKLPDTDELFARVLLPCVVVIDVPELDDALLATHSAVKSAKVYYAVRRLKESASASCPESCLDVLRRSRRSLSATQKHSEHVNTKKSTN